MTVFEVLKLERHLNLCLFGPLVMLFNIICEMSLEVSVLFRCFYAVKLALTFIGKTDHVLPKIKEEEKDFFLTGKEAWDLKISTYHMSTFVLIKIKKTTVPWLP